MDKNIFGKNLQKARMAENMRKKALSSATKITVKSITKFETSVSFPNSKQIIEFAKAFNCSVNYFFTQNASHFDFIIQQQNS